MSPPLTSLKKTFFPLRDPLRQEKKQTLLRRLGMSGMRMTRFFFLLTLTKKTLTRKKRIFWSRRFNFRFGFIIFRCSHIIIFLLDVCLSVYVGNGDHHSFTLTAWNFIPKVRIDHNDPEKKIIGQPRRPSRDVQWTPFNSSPVNRAHRLLETP